MHNIQIGIDLLECNEFNEAYDHFNKLLELDQKNIHARYYRAFTDFFHIRKKFQEDYLDFKYLVDKKTKYKETALPLLVILADELRFIDEVIKYGRMATKFDSPYLNDVRSILVKALAESNNMQNAIEALGIIEQALEIDEEETIELYLQKVEIQMKFNDLDGAEATIQQIFTKFPASENTYFAKGKLAFIKAGLSKEEDDLDDAVRAFKIALEYEPNFTSARLFLSEALALQNKLDDAFTALDGFLDTLPKNITKEQEIAFKADLVVEKVKICEAVGNFEAGLSICTEFLENNDSWKVYYSLGYIQNIIATSFEDLKVSRNNLLKAYELNNDNLFLPDLVTVNTILKDFRLNDTLINKAIEAEPDNGLLYYLLAENTARLNYDYDALISLYNKAYNLGYLDDASYVIHVSFLVEKPLELIKKYKKALLNEKYKSIWDMRRAGIRYLFGECGFKQNLKLAYNLLSTCNTKEPNEPCIMTIYARCLELMGNKTEAFKLYLDAYKIYKTSIHMTCNCANGYLAYSYLNGVGTKKDIDKAKELIIEALNKDGCLSASINIYHYAYFALLGEDGFDLEKAYEYLSSDFSFDRYDIVRYLYINKVLEKLGKMPKYNEEDIKICLSNISKEYKKYYLENKDKDVIYPYYKNF